METSATPPAPAQNEVLSDKPSVWLAAIVLRLISYVAVATGLFTMKWWVPAEADWIFPVAIIAAVVLIVPQVLLVICLGPLPPVGTLFALGIPALFAPAPGSRTALYAAFYYLLGGGLLFLCWILNNCRHARVLPARVTRSATPNPKPVTSPARPSQPVVSDGKSTSNPIAQALSLTASGPPMSGATNPAGEESTATKSTSRGALASDPSLIAAAIVVIQLLISIVISIVLLTMKWWVPEGADWDVPVGVTITIMLLAPEFLLPTRYRALSVRWTALSLIPAALFTPQSSLLAVGYAGLYSAVGYAIIGLLLFFAKKVLADAQEVRRAFTERMGRQATPAATVPPPGNFPDSLARDSDAHTNGESPPPPEPVTDQRKASIPLSWVTPLPMIRQNPTPRWKLAEAAVLLGCLLNNVEGAVERPPGISWLRDRISRHRNLFTNLDGLLAACGIYESVISGDGSDEETMDVASECLLQAAIEAARQGRDQFPELGITDTSQRRARPAATAHDATDESEKWQGFEWHAPGKYLLVEGCARLQWMIRKQGGPEAWKADLKPLIEVWLPRLVSSQISKDLIEELHWARKARGKVMHPRKLEFNSNVAARFAALKAGMRAMGVLPSDTATGDVAAPSTPVSGTSAHLSALAHIGGIGADWMRHLISTLFFAIAILSVVGALLNIAVGAGVVTRGFGWLTSGWIMGCVALGVASLSYYSGTVVMFGMNPQIPRLLRKQQLPPRGSSPFAAASRLLLVDILESHRQWIEGLSFGLFCLLVFCVFLGWSIGMHILFGIWVLMGLCLAASWLLAFGPLAEEKFKREPLYTRDERRNLWHRNPTADMWQRRLATPFEVASMPTPRWKLLEAFAMMDYLLRPPPERSPKTVDVEPPKLGKRLQAKASWFSHIEELYFALEVRNHLAHPSPGSRPPAVSEVDSAAWWATFALNELLLHAALPAGQKWSIPAPPVRRRRALNCFAIRNCASLKHQLLEAGTLYLATRQHRPGKVTELPGRWRRRVNQALALRAQLLSPQWNLSFNSELDLAAIQAAVKTLLGALLKMPAFAPANKGRTIDDREAILDMLLVDICQPPGDSAPRIGQIAPLPEEPDEEDIGDDEDPDAKESKSPKDEDNTV